MNSCTKETGEGIEKETFRIEAFSDGVFAIAITLLVLDLKVPPLHTLESRGLAAALAGLWPAYLAYVIGFVNMLIMWVCHHNIFSLIKKTDGKFLYLNGFLLFTVTLMPFTTALLSEYIATAHAGAVAAIFSGAIFLNCLSFNFLWYYASENNRLVGGGISPRVIREIRKNGLVGLPFYVLAVLAAFYSPVASICICSGLAVFFAVKGTVQHLDPKEVAKGAAGAPAD